MRYSLLVSVVFSLFLVQCSSDQTPQTDLWNAVPPTAVAVAETHDLPRLVDEFLNSPIYSELESLNWVKDQYHLLEQITSLYPQDSLYKQFSGKSFILTANLSGAGKYDLLFLSGSAGSRWEGWKMKLDKSFPTSTTSYGNLQIGMYELKGGTLYAAESEGILAFSFNRLTLEQGLRQIQSPAKIQNTPGFKQLRSTANTKDPVNLYLRTEGIPEVLKWMMPGIKADAFSHVAPWMEVDLDWDGNACIASGVAFSPDSSNAWMATFNNQKTVDLDAPSQLPARTAAWMAFGSQNGLTWQARYHRYLEKKNQNKPLERLLANAPLVKEHFFPLLDQQWGAFFTETPEGQSSKHHLAYLQVRDEQEAMVHLRALSDSSSLESYREHVIYQLKLDDVLPLILGVPFRGLTRPYWTIHQSMVYFAAEPEALKGVVNDLLAEQLLGERMGFQNLKDQLNPDAHVWMGFQNPEYLSWLREWSDKDVDRIVEENREQLGNLRWGAVVLKQENNLAFISGMLVHSTEKPVETQQIWALKLDAPLLGKPEWVVNHYTKKKEILVQDQAFNLYLIDGTGEILWKRPVGSAILGEVHQIDMYRNNRLQLLYNTAESLYVLDRNGQDVAPFPIKLKEKATAGVAAFDYDRTRNYRFVIPSGIKLLNFDVEGKEVKGWEFKKALSPIEVTPKHYNLAGKDYIPVLDNQGRLYLLDRKGTMRSKKPMGTGFVNQELYLIPGKTLSETALTGLNKRGQQLLLYLNGKADSLDVNGMDDPMFMIRFEKQSLFVNRNKLVVRDEQRPYTKELDDSEPLAPQAFIFKSKRYAGVTQPNLEEVWIFNQDGEPLPGCPLFGSTAFVAGDLQLRGNLNVVVGASDGSLICYKLE